ncbi:hypothetical protein FQN57_000025 [Myotisia sp. PD_48]|nr:hypothetical protein FQN57_000025 [Myotisia sp. PD_48]
MKPAIGMPTLCVCDKAAHIRFNAEGDAATLGYIFGNNNPRLSLRPDDARILTKIQLPLDNTPATINKLADGLEIEWSRDGHRSRYNFDWLKNHVQPAASSSGPIFRLVPYGDAGMLYRVAKVTIPEPTWNKSTQILNHSQRFHMKKLWHQKKGSENGRIISYGLPYLEKSLASEHENLTYFPPSQHRYGFSFVKGCPPTPEATEKLLERLAFIRPTHYGGFWDFTSDLSMKDTAYTSQHLNCHTDTTYFTEPAGLQMFHILHHTQGKGGETLLVDGFAAARTLLAEDPEAYKVLSEVKLSSHSSGNEDVCIRPAHSFSVLNHLPDSPELYQVRWNNDDRAPGHGDSIETINRWYQAAKKWNEILKRPSMEICLKLEPGTPLIFDNWRVLHGRLAFTGNRRMCGGYINYDDYMSRTMLLKHGRDKLLSQI